MDRMGRLFAALRVVLVAMAVWLLGSATFAAPASRLPGELDGASAHAQATDAPDPGPAVAELRDEDPRSGPEADGLAHGPRTTLAPPFLTARRLRAIRGPPTGSRGVPWRPRSSRGPPVQA